MQRLGVNSGGGQHSIPTPMNQLALGEGEKIDTEAAATISSERFFMPPATC
jgi:hypothetical protein